MGLHPARLQRRQRHLKIRNIAIIEGYKHVVPGFDLVEHCLEKPCLDPVRFLSWPKRTARISNSMKIQNDQPLIHLKENNTSVATPGDGCSCPSASRKSDDLVVGELCG